MDDRARVEALLGRAPRGDFTVVVRDDDGDPVVIRNAPFLDDGTPMPTRYYLVGEELVGRVSRLEAAGGVRRAQDEVPAEQIADAHARYAAERDAEIPDDHHGPRPTGGVGGTRRGVKCLHAHVAYSLAGGDDPVGRWALDQLERGAGSRTDTGTDVSTPLDAGAGDGLLHVVVDDEVVTVWTHDGTTFRLPVGPRRLFEEQLGHADVPAPEQLTNALAAVSDRLDDVLVEAPALHDTIGLAVSGHHADVLARVEIGDDTVPDGYVFRRADLDEVFRTLATEGRNDRRANPGLPAEDVDTVVPACCVLLGFLRRLDLQAADLERLSADTGATRGGGWS
jgi:hypothetical protein